MPTDNQRLDIDAYTAGLNNMTTFPTDSEFALDYVAGVVEVRASTDHHFVLDYETVSLNNT